MAGFAGIAAAGRSIERLLEHAFRQDEPIAGRHTRAVLIRTADLERTALPTAIGTPALSILPYRVTHNAATRAAWSAIGSIEGRVRLPLDLHVLLTPWADNAEAELRILGRAMQALEIQPILAGPLLAPITDWATNEVVQVTFEVLEPDALIHLFDALPIEFRLSVSYVARVIRVDARQARPEPEATTVVLGGQPGLAP